MSNRQEFSRPVKVEIIKRATRNGIIYCEKCGAQTKKFQIDHITADGLKLDKSKPLTAKDGELLCAGNRKTCHGNKTASEDVPAIAEAKRREAKHLGANDAPRRQIRSKGFEKREKPPKIDKSALPPLPRRVCGRLVEEFDK